MSVCKVQSVSCSLSIGKQYYLFFKCCFVSILVCVANMFFNCVVVTCFFNNNKFLQINQSKQGMHERLCVNAKLGTKEEKRARSKAERERRKASEDEVCFLMLCFVDFY
jgi:hypothetical protein